MRSERPSSRSYSVSHSAGGRSDVSESEADKKRNKLGYQRISIACAHCRRRKIRCVVDEDDSQQRCQTCIKLKKECVFYPVDQQGPVDNRSQISSKGSAASGTSASAARGGASSSPSSGGARTYEGRDYGSFHGGQSGSSSSFQGLPIEPGRPPVSVSGSYAESDYDYRQANDAYLPRSHAQHPYSPTHPVAPVTGNSSSYWRPGDGRPSIDYSPYPSSTQSGAVVDMHAHRTIPGVGIAPQPDAAWSSSGAVDASGHAFAYAPSATSPYAVAGRYPPTTLDVQTAPMIHPTAGVRGLPTARGLPGHANPYMMPPQGPVTTSGGGFPPHHGYAHQWYPGSSYSSRTS